MQIEVDCIQAVKGHNQCIMNFNLGSTYYLNLYILRYKEVWTILNSGGFLVNFSFYIIEQFSLNTYQLIISKTMRSLRCDGFFKTCFFQGVRMPYLFLSIVVRKVSIFSMIIRGTQIKYSQHKYINIVV